MLGPAKWTYFYLYVILDVFSRYVVGWTVQPRETGPLAEQLITDTLTKQNVPRGQLTIHADRGSSMTSKPVAFLLADLGVGSQCTSGGQGLISRSNVALAAETAERGKRVVLIIDEAHLLDAESLEGIRCLANMGMDQTAPFCLLLLGQPTLRRRLRQGTFTALDQRIAVRYAIAGLDPAETTSYIQHHLALAGRSDTLFSDDAVELIHSTSRGLPRLINNLAVQSLIAAFASKKAIVDQSTARIAVAEISAE